MGNLHVASIFVSPHEQRQSLCFVKQENANVRSLMRLPVVSSLEAPVVIWKRQNSLPAQSHKQPWYETSKKQQQSTSKDGLAYNVLPTVPVLAPLIHTAHSVLSWHAYSCTLSAPNSGLLPSQIHRKSHGRTGNPCFLVVCNLFCSCCG